MKTMLSLAVLVLAISSANSQSQKSTKSATDWKAVDDAMGRAGQDQPDGTHKFSMARGDLKVTVDDVQVKPGFALGSWAAFHKIAKGSEVMGDLVLAEDEVAPVMDKLQAAGLEITALHNHLLHETPRVMYMHIHGNGDAVKLASGIKDALSATKTPPPSTPPAQPPDLGFDTKQIDSILGHLGKNNNGVYQVAVPRAEKITENAMVVPNSMGLATALNFQPTGGGKAATTGDFVLIGKEVNPVIKALRAGGVQVTALHSHMLGEQPRLFFMHFWGNDDALKLARTLRTALDQTNSVKAK
ncbi:MAG TPA: DUF1259 domain-containing protein [Candidatus Limnocylindrales bacterium]|jgi:biotin operon repressor|nr:DUF1259 domain-containing protein [Candidatus Limnocylindrales bacterium]